MGNKRHWWEGKTLHTLLCEDVCHVYSTGAEEGRGLSEGRVIKEGEMATMSEYHDMCVCKCHKKPIFKFHPYTTSMYRSVDILVGVSFVFPPREFQASIQVASPLTC